jgi:hypothetical protein
MKELVLAAWILMAFSSARVSAEGGIKTAANSSAPSPLEFVGFATVAKETRFVLFDPIVKESSPWVKVDEAWRVWVVTHFDAKTETLTVRSKSAEFILRLRDSKIIAADPLPLPALVKGTYVLRDGMVVYSADAQLRLGNGVIVSSPDGSMISDQEQKYVAGERLNLQTTHGTKQAVGGVIIEVGAPPAEPANGH